MGTINNTKRAVSYLKRNGLAGFAAKVGEKIEENIREREYRPASVDNETIEAQKKHVFESPSKISILVPVYETDPLMFEQMLESVGNQTYGNWELILADGSLDDHRRAIVRSFTEKYYLLCRDSFGTIYDKVTYLRTEPATGISANTNEALAHATGDYVALLDHDDILEKTALFDIMSAIEDRRKLARDTESIARIMAVYSDEDKISEDGTKYFEPNFKPDFDPVLLCTNNYICHLFVVDTNLAKSVGGLREKYDGAQDHDLILRTTEDLRRDQIIHVPKVLYHWRCSGNSTAENPEAKRYAYDAGKRAVKDRFRRAGIEVRVTDSPHIGFYDIEYQKLHKSVISLTAGQFKKMVENGGFVPEEEFVMILSDDLIPSDETYIEDMMSAMHLQNIGAVTGRIIGKDGKVESAGFDMGKNGKSAPRFAGLRASYSGYMHRARLDHLVGGFSTDCVLLRMSAVDRVFPDIVLKDRFDIYYMQKAVFKRRSR